MEIMKVLMAIMFSVMCIGFSLAQSQNEAIGNCKQVDQYTVECDVDTTKVDLKDEENIKRILKEKKIIQEDNAATQDPSEVNAYLKGDSTNKHLGQNPFDLKKEEEITI